jgi:hypothetical protein
MALNRDQILGAQDLKTATVPTPEWGGDVLIRAMTALQRDQMMGMIGAAGATVQDSELKAFLCAQCAVDEDGKRLFTDEDVAALRAKNPLPLDRIGEAVLSMSKADNGATENAVKN